jgi:hypothetical protein
LYRYFVSQSTEFCPHNPLCCFSTSVYCCCLCRCGLSPETFGYALVLYWSTSLRWRLAVRFDPPGLVAIEYDFLAFNPVVRIVLITEASTQNTGTCCALHRTKLTFVRPIDERNRFENDYITVRHYKLVICILELRIIFLC